MWMSCEPSVPVINTKFNNQHEIINLFCYKYFQLSLIQVISFFPSIIYWTLAKSKTSWNRIFFAAPWVLRYRESVVIHVINNYNHNRCYYHNFYNFADNEVAKDSDGTTIIFIRPCCFVIHNNNNNVKGA